MSSEMLRPADAAKRFGVSTRTLARWADSGLIGRSHVRRLVFLSASDISDLIASREERRTVLPFGAQPSTTVAPSANDWRSLDFWKEG